MIKAQTQTSNYLLLPISLKRDDEKEYKYLLRYLVNFEECNINILYVEGDSKKTKFVTDFFRSKCEGTRECQVVEICEDVERVIYNGIIKITNFYADNM